MDTCSSSSQRRHLLAAAQQSNRLKYAAKTKLYLIYIKKNSILYADIFAERLC
jgi:hypothetical protein